MNEEQDRGGLDRLLSPTTNTIRYWDADDLDDVGPVWAVFDDAAEWSPVRQFPHRPDEQPITEYRDLDAVLTALLDGVMGDDGTGYLASQMLVWTADPRDENGRLQSQRISEPEGGSYRVTVPPDHIMELTVTISGATRHGAPLTRREA